jgi:TonB family protein
MTESLTAFGDFLLLKQRSQDGLGSVWRAGEMERTGFKRIAWVRRFDQGGLDRAALEAGVPLVRQLAQAFKATNLVRNASFGSEGGVPYLAYDYVPGQPLDRLLAKVFDDQFPIAIDNALLIAEKISAALAAALAFEVQGEPLVHGFLIPHLVLVGNDGEAMVAGFGLTKGLLANLDRVAVHDMAAPYLAPEVLLSYSTSRRADVYSLGAILYQLLCGEPLPADPAARAAALEHPQLALDEGPVPEDVLAVLRKSLASRPEDRYSSAVDFKRELEKLLYGGAYSPTTFNLALFMDRLYRQEIEEEDRELQRERTLDVTGYYRPPKAAVEAPVAAAPAPASRTGLYIAIGAVAVLAAVVVYLLVGRPAPQQEDMAKLIESAVAKQLAEIKQREEALKTQNEQAQSEMTKLREQLAQQQQKAAAAPAAGAKVSEEDKRKAEEEQRKAEDLAKQLAAREAEQKRRDEELRRLQEQRAKAEAQAQAKAAERPTSPPAIPTLGAVTPTAAPESKQAAPALQPTTAPRVAEAPTAVPATAPAADVVAGTKLGGALPEAGLAEFSKVDTIPVLLVDAKPDYPAIARKARVEGVVTLECTIDVTGSVKDIKVVHGLSMGVTEAAIKALKQRRYKPATVGGKAVGVRMTVNMTFRLQ